MDTARHTPAVLAVGGNGAAVQRTAVGLQQTSHRSQKRKASCKRILLLIRCTASAQALEEPVTPRPPRPTPAFVCGTCAAGFTSRAKAAAHHEASGADPH